MANSIISIIERLRGRISALDAQVRPRGFSCSADFYPPAGEREIQDAERRAAIPIHPLFRDFYTQANGAHISLIESASGNFYSGIVLETLDALVEEMALVRQCAERETRARHSCVSTCTTACMPA